MSIPKRLVEFPYRKVAPVATDFVQSWRPAVESLRALKKLPDRRVAFTVFHRPESKASSLILQSIRKQQAEVEAYTPTTAEDRPSLVVEVLERIPTVDEFKKLHHCKLSQPSIMSFISVTPKFKAHPTNAQALHDVVSESPEALRWPIVVNWETGDIAIGKDKPALRSMMRPIKLLSGQVPPQFKKQGKAVLSEKEVDWSKTA